jgi:glycosyltransferase involved in cell wall biosynthesis
MKKICFVVSSPTTAQAFLKEPMQVLAQYYTIHLVVNTNNAEQLKQELPIAAVHVLPIERGINPIKDLFCLLAMIRFLQDKKFDALHSISPKAGLMAMLGGFITSVSLRTHTFTGQVWANKKGLFKGILKRMDRLISFCATHVLVDGKSQLHFLREQGVVGIKASVLGKGSICGVSLERFSPAATIRKERRKQLSIPSKEWVFMFLGRLNKDKGIIDLIDAFTQIDQGNFPCSLYLIGHDEEEIKNRFQTISSKIHFIPHEKKPEELLQACDTFCLPSYREGFGLSVIEASALEKPIICSDAYGLADTIIEGQTGLRHRVGDVSDLKSKMLQALQDPSAMKKMGIAGRKYIKENFEANKLLAAWESFYTKKLHL